MNFKNLIQVGGLYLGTALVTTVATFKFLTRKSRG